MRKAIRPWLTVGVAAVGAGTIVVAPSSVSDDQVRVENSAVVQHVTQSPLQYYPEVLSRSLTNAGRLVDEYLEDPLPVVRAIADNQHHAVVEILRAAAELDPEAFAHTVLAAANQPVASLGRVVGSGEPFRTANSLLVRLAMPAASGVLAGGAGAAEVVDAATDLDPVRAVGALANIPARTADGLLNGRVDGQRDEYFGLLGSVVEAPVTDQISGPVDYLIHSLRDIGETIAAPPSAADTLADPAAAPVLDTPASTVREASDADEDGSAAAEGSADTVPARGRATYRRHGATPRHAAESSVPRHTRGTDAAADDGPSA